MKGITTVLAVLVVIVAPTYKLNSVICSKVKCNGLEVAGKKYQQAFQNDIRRMGIK